jgi:CheY-like chemotaxis protein
MTRVLVVDGIAGAATSLSHFLQINDSGTAVGCGGDMGIRVSLLFHPDLDSSGQDGCGVLAKARCADAWFANAMVIGLTSADYPRDERRYLAAGVDRVVRKPSTLRTCPKS